MPRRSQSKSATLASATLQSEATPEHARRVEAELPDYLPGRMLNEYVYCPRLFFYEWVEGIFAHSADTIEGELRHEKLETKSDPLPPPEHEARVHSRSVNLSSETHRLIAKMDLVEGEARTVTPVDYKKGRPRDGDDGPEVWPADRVQLCAQALILRDNGYQCDEAVAYYHATRQRVRVPIDEALVSETLAAIEGAKNVALRGRIPKPLTDSPKCPRCSLVGICLPDETALVESLPEFKANPQLSLFDTDELFNRTPTEKEDVVRRLVPARDDLRPLYVTGHGLTIGKSGDVLQIRERQKPIQEVRIGEISQVNAFGNVQFSAAAIQGLCWAEKPIAHFTFGGWFYGSTQGLGLKNVFLRKRQFALSEDRYFCLSFARELVAAKIRNQRTLLRRNHIEPPAIALAQLKRYAEAATNAEELDELLGIEGNAARIYFANFPGLLKADNESADASFTFEFSRRNRRPPADPVNALLSFAYSLLTKDLTIIGHSVGLDPFIGFFHQPRFGRPALALDLMEEFRPLIADSVVINAINTGMVTSNDFIRVGLAVALTPRGRKGFLRAYEQRMDALVTHPLFGYRVNYRRVLEIQTRLLARLLTGEARRYTGFETR
ncbi:MAG TPA: CRISPR-associated endonuclease Cas1 [Candidatus Binataceae bacterium]|nr:CRISPR-associated endonuclease Cas1 [Candidatus Binataceae bacterium]